MQMNVINSYVNLDTKYDQNIKTNNLASAVYAELSMKRNM